MGSKSRSEAGDARRMCARSAVRCGRRAGNRVRSTTVSPPVWGRRSRRASLCGLMQAQAFRIHPDPRHRPSVPDLRVCRRPNASIAAAPSVGPDCRCSPDRSPESVVIPTVLLPERFRAVLRLRRRPKPDSPAGLDAKRDYKRGSVGFPDVALADLNRALRGMRCVLAWLRPLRQPSERAWFKVTPGKGTTCVGANLVAALLALACWVCLGP